MADKKVIAIVFVLILVIAAAGAFLVLNKGGSSKSDIDRTGRLMILGNADNNDSIDSDDVKTIRSIVKDGTWDKEKYPYADANNDGEITDADADYIDKIIAKTCGYVYYVNALGEIKSVHYPVEKFVCVGSFAINSMIVLGQDKC
ncbi:MAG: hypothetical protein IJ856_07650, partial [Candidatus Methanomethylophilaceae archaeon]|nr:hypothetical protein [Candidatus Methanomethylophilaceae archaeon]